MNYDLRPSALIDGFSSICLSLALLASLAVRLIVCGSLKLVTHLVDQITGSRGGSLSLPCDEFLMSNTAPLQIRALTRDEMSLPMEWAALEGTTRPANSWRSWR
jgi:hypothetical protein